MPRAQRRRLAWLGPVCMLSLGCGAAPAGEAAPAVTEGVAEPPAASADLAVQDVVLITVDTLRADAVGFGGAGPGVTPNMDRLAAAGRVYDNAHAHNVVTLPSHANMLTGLLPYQHGVRDNAGFRLGASTPTLATILEGAGFATAAVVGAFVLDARFGLDRGFDLYDDALPEGGAASAVVPVERRGDEVVARGLAWWRENAGKRRFLWLHLFDPHAPYAAPPPHSQRYPANPYRAEVAAVDGYLEPVLETLLAAEGPPALIVFTSDHGEALGDHGELTHGLFAYEATLAVPLVLAARGLPPGRSPEPVGHVDLLPTILDAVGLEAPVGIPGRSLLAAPPADPPATYFEALTASLDRGWAPLRGAIGGSHKLVSLPIPELYDLETDPGEAVNLFAEKRPLARQLAAALPSESLWPPPRGTQSAETESALRALGYLGGSAASRSSYGPQDDPKRLVHLDRQMHRVIDHYQRGEIDRATTLVREVLTERPDMAIAYYYLAQFLLDQDQLVAAIEVMTTAYDRGATTQALVRQLGMSLAEAGRMSRALEILRPLADSRDPDSLNAVGLVLSEAGAQVEAKRILERVFEHDPRNATAHQHLALVAMRSDRWTAARDHARRALELSAALDQAWNFLGSALYQLGEPRQAVDAWRRAVEIAPRNFDALFNLAFVALEVGELEIARSALESFVATAPTARYGPDIERARTALRGLTP